MKFIQNQTAPEVPKSRHAIGACPAGSVACLAVVWVLLTAMIGCTPRYVEDPSIPAVDQEFRGVWVGHVAQLDWPLARGMTPEQQRAALTLLLDRAKEANFNAVLFQTRSTGDAMYDTELAPWSEWLTGETGVAPEPAWDPLAFAIREAHARGLQLHAWVSPFRLGHPALRSEPAGNHLAITHPQLVRDVGSTLWLDPGEPQARELVVEVLEDLARRYDLDGILLDDAFYPYPQDAQGRAFPDDTSYERHGGSFAERAAWRRDNVNRFVHDASRALHRIKPEMALGVSPFAIYRPGAEEQDATGLARPSQPEFVVGFDAYNGLYLDPIAWLEAGDIDYLLPQCYWPIANPDQSFITLYEWWVAQNPTGRKARHVWAGIFTGRTQRSDGSAYTISEVLYQVRWARVLAESHSSMGQAHFSANIFNITRPGQVVDRLASGPYATPALVPASPWLDAKAPDPPSVRIAAESGPLLRFELDPDSLPDDAALWCVQAMRDGVWAYDVYPVTQSRADLRVPGARGEIQQVVCFTVDRAGNRSVKVNVQR